MRKILIPALAVIALASCKTYSHSSRLVDVKNDDVTSLTYTATVSPDFKKRVKGASTKKHKTPNSAKDEAYYNAIKENDIDVLIDPIYSVSTSKRILFIFGGKSEAVVYGYAGSYEDVKSNEEVKEINYNQAIKDLKRIGKIKGILEENEQKSVSNNCCDDSENNGKTLISVTKQKSSIVDVYNKIKNQ